MSRSLRYGAAKVKQPVIVPEICAPVQNGSARRPRSVKVPPGGRPASEAAFRLIVEKNPSMLQLPAEIFPCPDRSMKPRASLDSPSSMLVLNSRNRRSAPSDEKVISRVPVVPPPKAFSKVVVSPASRSSSGWPSTVPVKATSPEPEQGSSMGGSPLPPPQAAPAQPQNYPPPAQAPQAPPGGWRSAPPPPQPPPTGFPDPSVTTVVVPDQNPTTQTTLKRRTGWVRGGYD